MNCRTFSQNPRAQGKSHQILSDSPIQMHTHTHTLTQDPHTWVCDTQSTSLTPVEQIKQVISRGLGNRGKQQHKRGRNGRSLVWEEEVGFEGFQRGSLLERRGKCPTKTELWSYRSGSRSQKFKHQKYNLSHVHEVMNSFTLKKKLKKIETELTASILKKYLKHTKD